MLVIGKLLRSMSAKNYQLGFTEFCKNKMLQFFLTHMVYSNKTTVVTHHCLSDSQRLTETKLPA